MPPTPKKSLSQLNGCGGWQASNIYTARRGIGAQQPLNRAEASL